MKITLCGSTRFMEQYHTWNKWLALNGHVVYSVATSVKGDFQPSDNEKETLDLVHLAKIEESDAILVINCLRLPDQQKYSFNEECIAEWFALIESYIGESTNREIKWACIRSKARYYTADIIEKHFYRGSL